MKNKPKQRKIKVWGIFKGNQAYPYYCDGYGNQVVSFYLKKKQADWEVVRHIGSCIVRPVFISYSLKK